MRASSPRAPIPSEARGRLGAVRVDERRPTREVERAGGRRVPDVVASGLRVLFCGINPSLYSAAAGHHFARPGNRFWVTLHRAGFTPRVLSPFEDRALLALGYGITNVVDAATARAEELEPAELRAGARRLERKVRLYRPRCLAVLGIGAYRSAWGRPRAGWGLQRETIGTTLVWVLANPSGLNASFQLDDLARAYRELRAAVARPRGEGFSSPRRQARRTRDRPGRSR
jgi:double-stranded uracil-DNA glycosylase